MADLPFPSIETISSTPSISQTATPPIVPNLGVAPTKPIEIPSALSPNPVGYEPIPEWTYKRFQLTDIFYSKIGISSITSLLTFSILATINPPFVQEKSENPIEISKPSFPILYCISLVIFVMMMVVPVSGRL